LGTDLDRPRLGVWVVADGTGNAGRSRIILIINNIF